MNLFTHSNIREIAKTIDQLRVVPRLVMMAYLYFSWDFLIWIKGIENPSSQHAAMFTILIGGIVGMFTAYAHTGPKSWHVSED